MIKIFIFFLSRHVSIKKKKKVYIFKNSWPNNLIYVPTDVVTIIIIIIYPSSGSSGSSSWRKNNNFCLTS